MLLCNLSATYNHFILLPGLIFPLKKLYHFMQFLILKLRDTGLWGLEFFSFLLGDFSQFYMAAGYEYIALSTTR